MNKKERQKIVALVNSMRSELMGLERTDGVGAYETKRMRAKFVAIVSLAKDLNVDLYS